MSVDLELIRSHNPIADVVGEKYPLRKLGARFIGIEHDSLVVLPETGRYFWNSRGEHGDAFDFIGRHVLAPGAWNSRNPDQFMDAVRFLAERAGLTLENGDDLRRSPAWAERQLVMRLHEVLLHTPPALAYVTQRRGWQRLTVDAARLGYMPQQKRALLGDLNLPDCWRLVVERFPSGMIVFPHVQRGRLLYLSGRSIEGKRHYNPPRDILGERQPLYNHVYAPDVEGVVLVEGQADAITFAEWGIPAIALGGMRLSESLLAVLRGHKRVFVALDNTDDARSQSGAISRALGCAAYVPQLPDGIKDANDWLVQHQATDELARQTLNRAPRWLDNELERAAQLEGLEREETLRAVFQCAAGLDAFELARFKDRIAALGYSRMSIKELMRAAKGSEDDKAQEDDLTGIVDDGMPVISPALGFYRDFAVVTVCMLERTRDDLLNIEPFIVTSKREMKRLVGKQVIQVDGRDVALRVLPDGSEFLRRWRFSDIKRFLAGETVAPGEVFNAVHDLCTRYIDFRSPVESHILTLWTCGTYLYTLFPAYPYLALNGPKNSGKSTVLRVLQPIAFNMITTSDPTGPAMFRLIHQTSCTVGIDEAERYHNPRDPGMQQIRQLLNSGYKAGMPAIRLIGEDMKPQAFEVYSPKILAAIAGLEDILASRCIAIPMRRTDRKLPAVPPAFDGADVRHLLYSFALTSFTSVARNYFERPDLHTLHNRSGELWSPLIALAAFFEEEGGVQGLLHSISEAASWDAQLSEGKALSDREEAVLQALELMTREETGIVTIRAWALRETVAQLLDESLERFGNPQWIGHILTRLHLLDEHRRKRDSLGISYYINPDEVQDMMRRYEVPAANSES